jgi:site-specific recombinase XerD
MDSAMTAHNNIPPEFVIGQAPVEAPMPRNFLQLDRLVSKMPELSDTERRITRAGLRACARMAVAASRGARNGAALVHQSEDEILAAAPCDVAWLNEYLFALPCKAFGLKPGSFSHYVTHLRRLLHYLGLAEANRVPPLASGGAWAALLRDLEFDVHGPIGLRRFAFFCEQRDIPPTDVNNQVVADFDIFARSRVLSAAASDLAAGVVKAWRKASRQVRHWPDAIVDPPPRREPYTLPFNRYPVSLQDQVAEFERHLAGGDRRSPFTQPLAPKTPRRGSTVKSRLFSLRQALAAYVLSGEPPDRITTLAIFADPKVVETVLLHFWRRALDLKVARGELAARPCHEDHEPADGRTTQTGQVATMIKLLVTGFLKVEEEPREAILAMCRDLTPPRSGTPVRKNREVMRQFDDPNVVRRLLRLAGRLMAEAERLLAKSPRRAAHLARAACALSILSHHPLRLANLCGLRFGRHLHAGSAKSPLVTRLTLTVADTKNHADWEWSVGDVVSGMIEIWRSRFRPLLVPATSDLLFPSPKRPNRGISPGAMRRTLIDTLATKAGITMTPNLFRHLCAKLVLENGGSIEDVRQMLGDKTLSVVLAHYAIVAPGQAARRYDATLRSLLNPSPPDPQAPRSDEKKAPGRKGKRG